MGVAGRPTPDLPGHQVLTNVVAPRYFASMGIPLLRGRDFGSEDRAGGRPVAIVNETLARRFFDGDAVGRTIWISGAEAEIVGVARDGKYRSIGEPAEPFLYLPLAQSYAPRAHLIVGLDPAAPAPLGAVGQAVTSAESGLSGDRLEPLARTVDASLFPARMGALLLGGFGVLALLLAVIGVYGVLAYSVGQRTREIGIRIALGAARRDVLRLVMGEGMLLVGAGLVIGLALAVAATRLLASFLYGISPTDAVTFGGVLFLLSGAALAASWLPARRASRVDPMVALRNG
jgi:predicted permease